MVGLVIQFVGLANRLVLAMANRLVLATIPIQLVLALDCHLGAEAVEAVVVYCLVVQLVRLLTEVVADYTRTLLRLFQGFHIRTNQKGKTAIRQQSLNSGGLRNTEHLHMFPLARVACYRLHIHLLDSSFLSFKMSAPVISFLCFMIRGDPGRHRRPNRVPIVHVPGCCTLSGLAVRKFLL